MGDDYQSTPKRHTWHPNQPIHPLHPSYKRDSSSNDGHLATTKPAVKRLFSESRDGIEQSEDAENGYYDLEQEDEGLSVRKRHRNRDWPLPNASQDAPSGAPLRPRPSAPHSPKYRRRTSSVQGRQRTSHHKTSSFIEGSMTDRVSRPPPAIYTEYEARMDGFAAERQDTARGLSRTDSGSFVPPAEGSAKTSSTGAKVETQKPSSIYRFGMNMKSAFNPSTWKQLFSKSGKEQKTQKNSDTAVGQDAGTMFAIAARNEAYQQLRASANFKAHTTQSSRFPPPQSMTRDSSRPAQKHASAGVPPHQSSVPLPHHAQPETPREEKRYGRFYARSMRDGEEIHEEVDSRAPSRCSIAQSLPVSKEKKKRNSFSFARPNFTRNSALASTSVVSLTDAHGLKRMPSKKELAESQKLVSKISNLEFQLSEAKRKLEALKREPIPPATMKGLATTLRERPAVEFTDEPPRVGRRRFVPGALATLPSERFLNAPTEPEHGGEKHDDDSDRAASLSADEDEFSPVTHTELIARAIGNDQPNHEQDPKDDDRKLQDTEGMQKHVRGMPSEEVAALHDENHKSDADSSSRHESEATSDTVIHYHESPQRVVGEHDGGNAIHSESAQEGGSTYTSDKEQNVLRSETAEDGGSTSASDSESEEDDLAEKQEVQATPKAELTKRKASTKRKSFGDKPDNDAYRQMRSDSDDDTIWDEAVKDPTPPRQRVSLPVLKKQKTSATHKMKIGHEKKKASVDSPKGSFVSSTKYPNRTSATSATSPKAKGIRDSPLSQRTLALSHSTEPKRTSLGQLSQPPSSAFTFSSSDHYVPLPGTSVKKALQKRPASPSIAPKKAVPAPAAVGRNGLAENSQTETPIASQHAAGIPPVPHIPKEMLLKHQEDSKVKQKKLTLEDIRRHQKASSIASSAHPHQDIARISTETDSTSMSVKAHRTSKGQAQKEETSAPFKWDEDVF